MSPEQVQGDGTVDAFTDIYSLGIIAFEMLTGHQPFSADSPTRLMMRHVLDPIPDLQKFNPDLPLAAQNVIERAMAKDKQQRYPTATPEYVWLVVSDGARCRTGPSRGFPTFGFLVAGDLVQAHGRNDEASWWWVEMPDGSGRCWVSAALVSEPVSPFVPPETPIDISTPSP